MLKELKQQYRMLQKNGLNPEVEKAIRNEIDIIENKSEAEPSFPEYFKNLYLYNDLELIQQLNVPEPNPLVNIKTLDELLEHDNQRAKDGFPKRIRIGKLMKPGKGKKAKVVVVPSTYEPKFYHDDSVTEDGEGQGTGGAGEGEEGEVIGEQQAQPQPGEGEGQGAGEGQGENHDITNDAFDLGRVLTEKFNLPNLKDKGKKKSLTKFKYDLTDRNRGFGQLLDKKATIKRVLGTNILLDRIKAGEDFDPEQLIINPKDEVYRIMSREKDFENQAVVFFLRDYSGSMQGKPTEVVTTQHLLIYSWLMYQYGGNVETRFILHDTEAKEVPDFYTYYRSQVAGGTKVHGAFELANKIVETENMANDYNIYVFYGTDGDDWDSTGKNTLEAIQKMLTYSNRLGITVAKNSWGATGLTTVEKYINNSGLLKSKKEAIRMDGFPAANASEDRIIEGIKKLVEE